MLLSTIGDFDPSILETSWEVHKPGPVDRLRQLDLREQLRAGRMASESGLAEPGGMVLIGFADGGGPVRLFTRSGKRPFAAVQPEERNSWCMYRIRIPFTVLESGGGNAAAPTAETADESANARAGGKKP